MMQMYGCINNDAGMANAVLFILNFCFYLGLTILTIMISLGVYYTCKYCCCNSCRKRRQRRFLGIRSHPSFVKAISVAFETSAASLEGLIRSGEDGDGNDGLKFNCPTCFLIKEGSYMSYGNMCPDCGASIV